MRLSISLFVGGIFFASSVNADMTVSINTIENGQTKNAEFYISGHKLASTFRNTGYIFNAKNNELITVKHGDKTYMRFDIQALSQMAEGLGLVQNQVQDMIQQKMAGMTPEQKAKIERLIPGINIQGLSKAKPSLPNLVQTGKTEKISGYSCRGVEILRDGKKLSEACLASIEAVGMSHEDFDTVKAFFSQIESFSSRMPIDEGNIQMSKIIFNSELLPITASDFLDGSRRDARLSYDPADIESQHFIIPDGYQQQNTSDSTNY
ncbi:MAG: hypothetical protein ACI88A_001630 [Paraglaciecola sp.]|jgi:hypothetical protein